MGELITAALAALVVELAKSAGHEAGIRLVAAIGPHLSAEQVTTAWHAMVEACEKYAADHPAELNGLAQGTGGDGGPRGPG